MKILYQALYILKLMLRDWLIFLGTRRIHYSIPSARDYYKILGLQKNANDKEIKKAYYQVSNFYIS